MVDGDYIIFFLVIILYSSSVPVPGPNQLDKIMINIRLDEGNNEKWSYEPASQLQQSPIPTDLSSDYRKTGNNNGYGKYNRYDAKDNGYGYGNFNYTKYGYRRYGAKGQPSGIRDCECGKVNQIPDPKYDPTLNYTGCSVNQELPHEKKEISGGEEAIPNQYPFMTHVYLPKNMCGGSLISNKHILTAYHCIIQYVEQKNFTWTNKSYIQLGGHNRKRKEEFVRYFIKYVKFPPGIGYNPKKIEKFDHDIAIIVLKTNVKFTKNIAPICLPQPNEIIDHKMKVIAIGWGNICDHPKAPTIKSRELKHVQTKLFDINILDRTTISKLPFNKLTNFLPTFVPIIEGKQQRTSTGDSGGPLIQQIKDTDLLHYKLVGATQANFPLTNGTIIVVYAAIIPFVSWIKQTVASEPGSYLCKTRMYHKYQKYENVNQ